VILNLGKSYEVEIYHHLHDQNYRFPDLVLRQMNLQIKATLRNPRQTVKPIWQNYAGKGE
jgi:hypothetical protein